MTTTMSPFCLIDLIIISKCETILDSRDVLIYNDHKLRCIFNEIMFQMPNTVPEVTFYFVFYLYYVPAEKQIYNQNCLQKPL